MEGLEQRMGTSLLDLPDSMLVIILCKLSPTSLCQVAMVCRSLKQICSVDQIWESHMNQKFGTLIRHPGAIRAWDFYISSRNDLRSRGEGSFSFKDLLPLPRSELSFRNLEITKSAPNSCSIMKWYSALQSGRFWLPAQVYNRENGDVGYMLSCYDAELCYDRHTDTFSAWYLPDNRRMGVIENGVKWDRVRAPCVDVSGHDLYTSECPNELEPGDRVEIQWRLRREIPYGWWYGEVGHLEACNEDSNLCRCRTSDGLVIEFKHHPTDSLWRKMRINRRGHSEEGNETSGFYGGLRRLHMEEVEVWMQFWPSEPFE